MMIMPLSNNKRVLGAIFCGLVAFQNYRLLFVNHHSITVESTKSSSGDSDPLFHLSLTSHSSSSSSSSSQTLSSTASTDSLENLASWPFAPYGNIDEKVRIFLIHVGKAGGVSLYRKLGIRKEGQLQRKLACHLQGQTCRRQDRSLEASKFGQATLARLHMMARSLQKPQREYLIDQGGANLLVFTVRDPIERLISAFNYHKAKDRHKENGKGKPSIKVFDCFPTLQDLALAAENKHSNPLCAKLAVDLLQGNVLAKSLQHFYYNYQYYASIVWTKKNRTQQHVAVVRTNHQWSDMARIEELLGGDPNFFLDNPIQVTHGSEKYAQNNMDNRNETSISFSSTSLASSLFSASTRRALCCILKDELQVYQDLIEASVNLFPHEKQTTLQSLWNQCGITPPRDTISFAKDGVVFSNEQPSWCAAV